MYTHKPNILMPGLRYVTARHYCIKQKQMAQNFNRGNIDEFDEFLAIRQSFTAQIFFQ